MDRGLWALEGVMLEYVKFGDDAHTPHQVQGLVLAGPKPSWWQVGDWAWTLRRAR